MALHEKMKLAIIAEELFAYFMSKGHQHIDVSMNVLEDETTFTVKLYESVSDIETELEHDLYCSRETELEEYGWDFNPEGQGRDLLHHLSMLIDYYEIDQCDEFTCSTFHRKHI